MPILIFKQNVLANGVTVLKNLSGGGSGVSEDADWPMANLTLRDRYSYWRTQDGLAAGTFNVDFDLGSSQLVRYLCLTNMRFYGYTPPAVGDAAALIYYDNGGTYPPAGWTFTGFALGGNLNDNVAQIDTTLRFLRFEFTMPGPPMALSFKLWAMGSADVVELSHAWSLETELTNRRIKQTSRSPAGLLFEFEPAQAHASDLAGGTFVLSTASLSEWQTLRDALSGVDSRFIVVDTDSSVIFETALPDGKIEATRIFPGLHSMSLALEAHS